MKHKEKALIDLFKQWQDCEKCELGKMRKKKMSKTPDSGNIVFGDGNADADIVVIGAGPGEEEDKAGVPYVDETGEILDTYLGEVGMDRDELFVMNVVACRPFSDVLDFKTKRTREENRDPTPRERELCRPLWREALYIVDPLLVVAMGKSAVSEVTGKRATSMRDAQGTVMSCEIPGRAATATYPVMAMYCPTTLAKSGHTFDGGPWHQALVAWRRAIYFVDKLKNLYYGTPMPDRDLKTEDLFVGGA